MQAWGRATVMKCPSSELKVNTLLFKQKSAEIMRMIIYNEMACKQIKFFIPSQICCGEIYASHLYMFLKQIHFLLIFH